MIPGPDDPGHPTRPVRGPVKDRRQTGVARGMAAALAVVILTLAVSWSVGSTLSSTDRVLRAVAAATVAALWLAAAIGHVAALRFDSPADIDAAAGGSGDSPRVAMANAVLRNTLEQVVLAIPAYLALAWVVEGSGAMIPTLAALFSVGRTLFWASYARGAAARAFGFALTFYSSVAALVIVVMALVGRLV
ncbi:MAPEG family protein [Sphingomonas sp. GM_Shp_1]|uniref:MAPEG family protein n=1 Tax=Sphingomonas sp. GM_Shp_1 TaxID=2937381 RepID=UPI00226B8848|nr:MAPEG family protein [Sphingomonas sp. GM_Shp_1]